MAGFSQDLQKKLLDHVLKGTAYSQVTNIYVGLCTAAPSDTTFGTECTGSGYARVICNSWVAATGASPSVANNTGVITFGTPGVSWGLVTHFVIANTLAGTGATDLMAWGTVTPNKTININDTVSFAANQLTLSLD